MTTLKQFQEEGEKFHEEWVEFVESQVWQGEDEYTKNMAVGNVADWWIDKINKQTFLAYELGKKEMLEIVLKEIEKKWTCHQVGCEWNRNRVYGNKVCDMNCANVLESIITSS